MCLERLSKKDDDWYRMALKICQDKDYAKDVVQDMYLQIYKYNLKNPQVEIKDVYIWVTIYNIIKDNFKLSQKYQKIPIEKALHIDCEDERVEFDDIEQMYLNRAKEFRYLDRGLLEESFDKGYRQIEKETGINYGFIYRTLKKTRKLILRDKFDELYKIKGAGGKRKGSGRPKKIT